MKKVAFYTLGCKLNYSETSSVSRLFDERGYVKTTFTDQPDIFVINTCSVTENADKKCKKIVREAKKISPKGYVVIMGCYAQLKPAEIAGIEGVDAVLGAAEKFRLFDYLDDFQPRENARVFASEIREAKLFHPAFSAGDRTRTFLKVQDGCNYGCAFCTIPMARGKSRSGSIDSVMDQVEKIAETEAREIVLTGVNIGDYGVVQGRRRTSFLELIQKLDEVQGIDRFRISSIEPNLLSDQIIDFVAGSRKFVPHFHVPLQSGNDKILKAMKRRYLSGLYRSRVERIKESMPHACIGVDVIAGFPGETESDFMDTYHFLNDLEVSYLHAFTFSERANTLAATMLQPVPIKDRHNRAKMLRNLSEKKRRAFYEEQLGSQRTVLFEGDVENGLMHGFTENYVRVEAKYDPLMINELKEVVLEGIADSGHVSVTEPEMAWA